MEKEGRVDEKEIRFERCLDVRCGWGKGCQTSWVAFFFCYRVGDLSMRIIIQIGIDGTLILIGSIIGRETKANFGLKSLEIDFRQL